MKKHIAIGAVIRPWGVKGSLTIKLLSGRVKSLAGFQRLFAGKEPDEARSVCLIEERVHKGNIVARFEDIDSIEAAGQFIGARIFVGIEEMGDLREDEYYIRDLIGLRAVLKEGRTAGIVKDVIETGGTDLLVIADGEKELLIPLCRSFCRRIDREKETILIDAPAELLELNEV